MSRRVVVVGAGNAALCAAIASRRAGADVLVLEAAPREEAGGNSAYTAGAMRVAHSGAADLRRVLDAGEDELARCDFGTYGEDAFLADVDRLTAGRANETLARVLVDHSLDTLAWMRSEGVGFEPAYGTQAFEQDGRWRFWGGLAVRVRGEGKGLVASLAAAAAGAGVRTRYASRASRLLHVTGGGVAGVALDDGERVPADAVVLACGGFEANAAWRERHLGEGWSRAKVRGTRFNDGAGIAMALDAGADRAGEWSGCHSVAWDAAAPDSGRLDVAHEYTRNSYQFSLVVNAHGRRFLDEGADFRNFTYAAYGREVLRQPGGVAWQVFDAKVLHLLRREYGRDDASMNEAPSIGELAASLNMPGLPATVHELNAAVDDGAVFDPSVLDGRATRDLEVPKSNWALALDTPPFRAYAVTCGITFTYGGLRADGEAHVLDERGRPIPGLFAAGELVGGLWHGNYAGGSGLTAGAVFGRLAGAGAARG